MKNPLRDEASAFQVVLLTLAGALLVVVAAWVNTWLGLAVFLLLLAAALWAIRGGLMQRPPRAHVVHDDDPARRILVLANETVAGEVLLTLLGTKAADVSEEMLLVCPALNSRVRTWTSDEDPARAEAQARLDTSLARLAHAGVSARGEIGDGDPLQALDDALREFPADEIVVSTHPPGRSHWLEQGVVDQARLRYDVPVTHVVVDLAAEPSR
jgi:GABA permease